jgi:hypothetical protein
VIVDCDLLVVWQQLDVASVRSLDVGLAEVEDSVAAEHRFRARPILWLVVLGSGLIARDRNLILAHVDHPACEVGGIGLAEAREQVDWPRAGSVLGYYQHERPHIPTSSPSAPSRAASSL